MVLTGAAAADREIAIRSGGEERRDQREAEEKQQQDRGETPHVAILTQALRGSGSLEVAFIG